MTRWSQSRSRRFSFGCFLHKRTGPTVSHLLLSLCILGLPACRRAASQPAGDAALVVTTQAARNGTLRDVATASGTIVPSSTSDWTVYAPDSGTIAELPKKEQDLVQLGDVLVRFDIPSLSQESAARQLEVAEATARLDRAKTDAARQASLFERGVTARNTYDASRLEVSAAEAALSQAVNSQSLLASQEDRAVIRARFPGVVLKTWHAAGDVVSGGVTDPVLRVIDPAHVQVLVQLPVPQLARIVAGQSATVRAIAGGSEPASVIAKQESTDPAAATGDVRIAFNGDTKLALDSPVSVEILLDQRTDAILVPASALQRDDEGPYVVVVGDDLRAHRREVRAGLVTRETAQIASGLTAGEVVVTSGATEVTDGEPVTIARQ